MPECWFEVAITRYDPQLGPRPESIKMSGVDASIADEVSGVLLAAIRGLKTSEGFNERFGGDLVHLAALMVWKAIDQEMGPGRPWFEYDEKKLETEDAEMAVAIRALYKASRRFCQLSEQRAAGVKYEPE